MEWIIFGQASTPSEIAWVSGLIQLATAGGLGTLAWYLVVKHIPFIEARHASERMEWLTYVRARDEQFERLTREALESVSQLRSAIEKLHT